MRKNLKRVILLMMAGLFVLPSLLNVVIPPPSAHAEDYGWGEGITAYDQARRWFFYRGMRACLEGHSGFSYGVYDKVSTSEIIDGTWMDNENEEGFGFVARELNFDQDGGDDQDGDVRCDDGSIWVRGATAFGFDSVVDLVCAMNRAQTAENMADKMIKPNGTGDDGNPDCESSTQFTFGLGDDGSDWQQSLTKALSDEGSGTRPKFDMNGDDADILLYVIGRESLLTFCGKKGDTRSFEDRLGNNTNDDNRVQVDVVNESTGEIDKDRYYVIYGDRDQDSEMHDVMYLTDSLRNGIGDGGGNDNEGDDLKCYEMARMTQDRSRGEHDYSEAYSDYIALHPNVEPENPNGGGNEDPDEESETSCAVDGVGWIVCPVMKFLGTLNDNAFGFLKSMLTIRPALVSDTATRTAWSAFRDIANVAFVIAFMVIVYSQLTSAGISNYGIKRMLPRLFIAAVLVNVSFWICAALVDVSNIVGSGIYSLLGTSIDVGGSGGATGDSTWTTVIAAVLIAAAGILLVVVIFLAPTVLLALALVLMILVARQAFVIMLIVLSPLAFVAYLLPNTEDLFKRWWKMLSATLMVFPIVGLVFGASTLASRIIMNVAQSGGDDEQLLKIVALSVLAIPLFAVPSLLIGSLSAAGAIGAKVSNLSNRVNKNATNKGKARFDASALGQYKKYRGTEREKRRALTQAGQYSGRNPLRKGLSKAQGAFYGSSASGAFGDRIVAAGTALADKEWDDEVKRQKTSMTGASHTELMKIMRDTNATAEKRAAAAGTIMSRDYRAGHLDALRAAGQMGQTDDKDIDSIQKQMAHDMKDKPFALGDKAAGQLGIGRYGKATDANKNPQPQMGDLDGEFKARLGEKLSASGLASMNPDELTLARDMAVGNQLDSTQLGNLQRSIAAARSDERLKVLIKPEAAKMHEQIMAKVSEATLDEAHQMNIQHDEERAAVQNALGGMEGNNPSDQRQP